MPKTTAHIVYDSNGKVITRFLDRPKVIDVSEWDRKTITKYLDAQQNSGKVVTRD